jgi:hypothetical protein
MTGEGIFAEQIASLFKLGCQRAGIGEPPKLSCASLSSTNQKNRVVGFRAVLVNSAIIMRCSNESGSASSSASVPGRELSRASPFREAL